jgi:hypothetical protein
MQYAPNLILEAERCMNDNKKKKKKGLIQVLGVTGRSWPLLNIEILKCIIYLKKHTNL